MRLCPSLFRLPSKLRRRARRSRLRVMFVLLAFLCILVMPFYFVYKPPNLLIRYFQYRWPDVLFHVDTSSLVVALTIDDTPSEYTTEILEVLKANGATATFFTIGAQIPGREKILQNIVLNGNELGNHAMHDEPSRSLSDSDLAEQINIVNTKIQEAYAAVGTEPPPSYFRPGSGFFSAKMLKVTRELAYQIVLGNIYPHDPQIPYWRLNARHILSMLRPGGIIICHDRRSWTVPMLKKVLPEMKRRGYRVVTVTELLKETRA